MHISRNLNKIPSYAITLGAFDGLHLGHQALIAALKNIPNTFSALITFSSHPQAILHPETPFTPLLTEKEKLTLLDQFGLDLVVILPFTPEVPYDKFLTCLHKKLHFSHLLLGEGATFGKDRKGDAASVRAFSKNLEFEVTYIPKVTYKGKIISSSRIREALNKGDTLETEAMLGRSL